jgi:O-antigen/teichoic acid export membrane protein
LRKLFQNKVVVFILSRYFSYVLQFVNSLLIAYFLGPFYLGIWGFLNLALQYLAFGNFGLDLSLNVLLSTGDFADVKRQSRVSGTAFLATGISSALYLLIALAIVCSGSDLFPKYHFNEYLLPVVFISCLNYFNVLLLNVCRAYSIFGPISIFQTTIQLLQLPMFIMFRNTELIWSLLIVSACAHAISLVIFLRKIPFRMNFKVDFSILKELYRRGFSLLSYALTFYILLLSTRTVVGYFYPVETLGLFTFACNIASAVIVGLSSMEFVLFPKMLNRFSIEQLTPGSVNTFREVRYLYMATTFFVVVCGLLCYPVLLLFFSDYADTVISFSYLVLSQVIISSGFGYATLIVSRGREYYLVVHGLIALFINMIFSILGYYLLAVPFHLMPLFLIFAFIYYDFKVIKMGRSLLGMKNGWLTIARDMMPIRLAIPLLILFASFVTEFTLVMHLCALACFFLLNFRSWPLLRKYTIALFREPNVINIKQ